MFPQFPSSADALVEAIPDGASIAFLRGPAAPLEIVRALIRKNVRDLHLITVPTGDIAADLLIGAGCVSSVETSGISLGEFGPAPNFVAAIRSGALAIRDSTCPAVYSALQAGEKGIPFMPMRGLLGSDILTTRPDYKVIENPYAPGDKIVVLPAVRPDYALIHVARADRDGDVHIANRAETRMLAGAARKTLVTAETITEEPIAVDPALTPGVLSGLYIDAIAPASGGAWPNAMPEFYEEASDHIASYAKQARTSEGFQRYLREAVGAESRTEATLEPVS